MFLEFLELRHEVSLLPDEFHETLSVEVLKANSLHSDFRVALPQPVKFIFQLLRFLHQLTNFPSEVSDCRLQRNPLWLGESFGRTLSLGDKSAVAQISARRQKIRNRIQKKKGGTLCKEGSDFID